MSQKDCEAEYLANREGYQVLRTFYLPSEVDDKLKAKLIEINAARKAAGEKEITWNEFVVAILEEKT